MTRKFPSNWTLKHLYDVAKIQTGLALGNNNHSEPIELPYLRVANVQDGFLDLREIKKVVVDRQKADRFKLRAGDVLVTEGGDFDKLGRGYVWQGEIDPCLHQNHIFAIRPKIDHIEPYFLATVIGSTYGRLYFLGCAKKSTNLASINSSELKKMIVPIPSLKEQCAISERVRTWERAERDVTRLIERETALKRGLMQRLLTGKQRFSAFVHSTEMHKGRFGDTPTDWQQVRVGDIAMEANQQADNPALATVLSCTKHRGLVDSLMYFGKRVFSDDTTGYKLVRRSQFAYATNHVEEGSIGLLTHREEGLVSPMYTVFETNHRVHGPFLYALFKTELYRHIFKSNTNTSVDRRGGLRWQQFAQISVSLPGLDEQRRIVEVLTTCDRITELLGRELELLKTQKRWVMDRLLSGSIGPEDKSEMTATADLETC